MDQQEDNLEMRNRTKEPLIKTIRETKSKTDVQIL